MAIDETEDEEFEEDEFDDEEEFDDDEFDDDFDDDDDDEDDDEDFDEEGKFRYECACGNEIWGETPDLQIVCSVCKQLYVQVDAPEEE